MKGQSTAQTGDINLAAALMSCGIPLDFVCPVTLIESTTRDKPYGSFRLLPISEDGMEDTQSLMSFWDGGPIREDHPMIDICQFIRDKPHGVLKPDEWLAHAVDWLRARGDEIPGIRKVDDIPLFTKSLPNERRSYILAFVFNRWTCLQLYNQSRRATHKQDDQRHILIDHKLNRNTRNELLARWEG